MTALERIQVQRAEEQVAHLTSWPKHDPDSWDMQRNHPPVKPARLRSTCLGCGDSMDMHCGIYCRACVMRLRVTGTVESPQDYLIWPVSEGHVT